MEKQKMGVDGWLSMGREKWEVEKKGTGSLSFFQSKTRFANDFFQSFNQWYYFSPLTKKKQHEAIVNGKISYQLNNPLLFNFKET